MAHHFSFSPAEKSTGTTKRKKAAVVDSAHHDVSCYMACYLLPPYRVLSSPMPMPICCLYPSPRKENPHQRQPGLAPKLLLQHPLNPPPLPLSPLRQQNLHPSHPRRPKLLYQSRSLPPYPRVHISPLTVKCWSSYGTESLIRWICLPSKIIRFVLSVSIVLTSSAYTVFILLPIIVAFSCNSPVISSSS